MADKAVVHIGENSPEKIAYLLMIDVMNAEKTQRSKKTIMDTYSECLDAVRGSRSVSKPV